MTHANDFSTFLSAYTDPTLCSSPSSTKKAAKIIALLESFQFQAFLAIPQINEIYDSLWKKFLNVNRFINCRVMLKKIL